MKHIVVIASIALGMIGISCLPAIWKKTLQYKKEKNKRAKQIGMQENIF